ncbi:MAG: P-loop containing nucleoside triphosphate hydrolase protein [Olpidium bornovanus]|uniref:P-loop containing nucleoside triphosphate hydrolase protein n=1 Tax=Olpidium bornovanus TaxID=278681 RepID=A0A8H7ZZJ2_9FUNG|nr:MAG: P-loop containing nucleoside triphosphate hydrolase protein [Olpidium bornovanus]
MNSVGRRCAAMPLMFEFRLAGFFLSLFFVALAQRPSSNPPSSFRCRQRSERARAENEFRKAFSGQQRPTAAQRVSLPRAPSTACSDAPRRCFTARCTMYNKEDHPVRLAGACQPDADPDAAISGERPAADGHGCRKRRRFLIFVAVTNLTFGFGGPPILENVTVKLPIGCRALLVGANGAGKTTFLTILAGKRMVRPPVSTLGRDPFSDMPKGITYLGTEFVRNLATRSDVSVEALVASRGGNQFPDRRDELFSCLDIDPDWRMHTISDGERRRVQIMLGLLTPWRLLLLDEVTVDLDVLVRRNLLEFLLRETETREGGASVLYATHIFDGLGSFPTHVIRMALGKIAGVRTTGAPVTVVRRTEDGSLTRVICDVVADFPELDRARRKAVESGGLDSPLLTVVENWLREDYQNRKAVEENEKRLGGRRAVRTRWDEVRMN